MTTVNTVIAFDGTKSDRNSEGNWWELLNVETQKKTAEETNIVGWIL